MGGFLPTERQLEEFNAAAASVSMPPGLGMAWTFESGIRRMRRPIRVDSRRDCRLVTIPEHIPDAELFRIDDQVFQTSVVRENGGFTANIWPEGIVYYDISLLDDTCSTRWLREINRWAARSRCVAFRDVLRFQQYKGHRVTVQSVTTRSSSSGVGLGTYDVQIHENHWEDGRTVLHEIGHVLGMIHEHQRSDRDASVEVLREGDGYCRYSHSLNFTEYDFNSIMHYPRYMAGEEVIRPRDQGVSINAGQDISNLDVEAIKKAYNL